MRRLPSCPGTYVGSMPRPMSTRTAPAAVRERFRLSDVARLRELAKRSFATQPRPPNYAPKLRTPSQKGREIRRSTRKNRRCPRRLGNHAARSVETPHRAPAAAPGRVKDPPGVDPLPTPARTGPKPNGGRHEPRQISLSRDHALPPFRDSRPFSRGSQPSTQRVHQAGSGCSVRTDDGDIAVVARPGCHIDGRSS